MITTIILPWTTILISSIAVFVSFIIYRRISQFTLNHENLLHEIAKIQDLEQNFSSTFSEFKSNINKDLRDFNFEIRRELSEQSMNLQNSLEKTVNVNESMRSKQMDSLKLLLSDLAEKILVNFNDLKTELNNLFSRSNELISSKQDLFRNQLQERLQAIETSHKEDARSNRQELKQSLDAFETNHNETSKHLYQKIEKQSVILSENQNEFLIKTTDKLKHLEERSYEIAKENRLEISSKQDSLRTQLQDSLQSIESTHKEDARSNRQELTESLAGFEGKLSETSKHLYQKIETQSSLLSSNQNEFLNKTTDKLIKLEKSSHEIAKDNRAELRSGLLSLEQKLSDEISKFIKDLRSQFEILSRAQKSANEDARASIIENKNNIDRQLKSIREDNTSQLDQIRHTVDKKLQTTLEKRLTESFKQVSDRLEQVHRGLGDMQNLAVGVGDLKKVLSNVKTRGVLGEYQLANILEQILSAEQYHTNVATKKDSRQNVEFAIKLPGRQDDQILLLPIDSKFPLESWIKLQQASESGDQAALRLAKSELVRAIDGFAKDISTKYINPPNTTDFAVMFLPIEGLYAEVMQHPKVFEKLQREYKITITGPTTLSAFLSSLSMGFRTLAVQKRTSEVWNVLALLKNEFESYTSTIEKVAAQFSTASKTLDTLQTTRTNQMKRKLSKIEVGEMKVSNSPDLGSTMSEPIAEPKTAPASIKTPERKQTSEVMQKSFAQSTKKIGTDTVVIRRRKATNNPNNDLRC